MVCGLIKHRLLCKCNQCSSLAHIVSFFCSKYFSILFFLHTTIFYVIFYYVNTIYFYIYVLQFTTFLTTTCNVEFIFKQLSYIFITILCIIFYNAYYFNSKEVSIIYNITFMKEFFNTKILIFASKRIFEAIIVVKW